MYGKEFFPSADCRLLSWNYYSFTASLNVIKRNTNGLDKEGKLTAAFGGGMRTEAAIRRLKYAAIKTVTAV